MGAMANAPSPQPLARDREGGRRGSSLYEVWVLRTSVSARRRSPCLRSAPRRSSEGGGARTDSSSAKSSFVGSWMDPRLQASRASVGMPITAFKAAAMRRPSSTERAAATASPEPSKTAFPMAYQGFIGDLAEAEAESVSSSRAKPHDVASMSGLLRLPRLGTRLP